MDEDITNGNLESLLYPERREENALRMEPDYSYINKELAKSGVNLSLLWTEYCNEVRLADKIPYMYLQFCDKYRMSITFKFCTFFTPKKCTDITDVSLRVNRLFLLIDNFHQLSLQL